MTAMSDERLAGIKEWWAKNRGQYGAASVWELLAEIDRLRAELKSLTGERSLWKSCSEESRAELQALVDLNRKTTEQRDLWIEMHALLVHEMDERLAAQDAEVSELRESLRWAIHHDVWIRDVECECCEGIGEHADFCPWAKAKKLAESGVSSEEGKG